MDLEAVRSFIEVKNTRSLSKASKILHISQPALSKQIQRLEADLEVTFTEAFRARSGVNRGWRVIYKKNVTDFGTHT